MKAGAGHKVASVFLWPPRPKKLLTGLARPLYFWEKIMSLMKKSSTLLLCLCMVASALVAQVNFTITPNPKVVTVPNPPTVTDVVAHAKIKNLTNEPRTFKWTRTTLDITPDCKTQICDRNNCYFAHVDSKQFTMLAQEDSTLDVHLVSNDPAVPALCCAIVHLKVEEVGNPDNTLTGIYIFEGCTSGTTTVGRASVRLFPNPAADFFALENAEKVAAIRVFSMDGRVVKEFEAAPGSRYPIADLPAGAYILALQNPQAETIGALELRKN